MRPLLLACMRQRGHGEQVAGAIGPYKLVAQFESNGTRYGDVVCLYEDPAKPALIRAGTGPAATGGAR